VPKGNCSSFIGCWDNNRGR